MLRILNLAVWILVLGPAIGLLAAGATGALGPDPGNELLHQAGAWGLRFLLLCLSMSSLRRFSGWPQWIVWRRRLGLAAWFYASLHVLASLAFVIGWDWAEWREAVLERPYIVLGLFAWLGLWPLALTSTRWARRRLGRRWLILHRSIYVIAILVCLHVLLQLRADWGEWLIYSLWLMLLLSERLWHRLSRPRRMRAG